MHVKPHNAPPRHAHTSGWGHTSFSTFMINWQTKSVPICQLQDYEHNPRRISKKEFEKLVRHLKEDGYHQRIIVNSDYTILGGHQRKKALLCAGFKESDEIEVLIPNRMLSPDELDRINIRDNLAFGEYDFDVLANRFEIDELLDIGIPEDWLNSLMGEAPDNEPENDADYGIQIWQLGEHQLIAMDGEDLDYVNGLLKGGGSAVVTVDAKYIAKVVARWEKETKKKAKLVESK